jgi:hypothetical protein
VRALGVDVEAGLCKLLCRLRDAAHQVPRRLTAATQLVREAQCNETRARIVVCAQERAEAFLLLVAEGAPEFVRPYDGAHAPRAYDVRLGAATKKGGTGKRRPLL